MKYLVYIFALSLLFALACPALANSIYDPGTGLPANECWQSADGSTWTQDPITVKLGQTVYFKGKKSTGAALSSHDWDTKYTVNTDQGAATLKALWDIDWPGPPTYGLLVDYTRNADAVLEHQYTSVGGYSVRMGIDDVYPGTWVDDLSPTPPYTYRLSDNSLSVTVVDPDIELTITPSASPGAVPQDQSTPATCTAYLTNDGNPWASQTVTFTTTDAGRFTVGEELTTTYQTTTNQDGYASVPIVSKDFRTGGDTATVTAEYEANPDPGGSEADDEEGFFWDMTLTQPEEGKWLMKGRVGNDNDEITLAATASHPSIIDKVAFWVKPFGGEFSLVSEETTPAGNTYSTSWNTDEIDPGQYTVKAVAHDNHTRTLAQSHDIYLYEIDLETRTLEGGANFVAESEEETPGAYVHFNLDNDNNNYNQNDQIADYCESSVNNEDDTMYMTMTISPLPTSGTVELSRDNGNGYVWKAQTKGVANVILVGSNPKQWDLSNHTQRDDFVACSDSLWAEGVGTTLNCDSTLTLKLLNGYEVGQDSVKQTYIAAKCGDQPGIEQDFPIPGLNHPVRPYYKSWFPDIKHCEWSILGQRDPTYNCIAYSVDDKEHWFDEIYIDLLPGSGDQDGVFENSDMDSFYYTTKGWTLITTGTHKEKAEQAEAMYYPYPTDWDYLHDPDRPSPGFHAARRGSCSCGANQWTMYESKCGKAHVIEHVWDQLNSPQNYGSPGRFYK